MAQLPARDVSLKPSWWRWLQRRASAIDPELWRQVRSDTHLVRQLEPARAQALADLAAQFLHEKHITPIGDLVLDAFQRTQLAALCCLPLIEFGRHGLRGWTQLLVYPQAFRVQRSHMDAAGVMHEYEDELIGESWEAGPLILSWADIQADLADPGAGFCVAVHEMAHKLDALDGVLDGTPLLPRLWQREWARDFQDSYDQFVQEVDAGVDGPIDPYAAESPEEFFAVASEYHFSNPALLQAQLPLVAAHLQRFYGPAAKGLAAG